MFYSLLSTVFFFWIREFANGYATSPKPRYIIIHLSNQFFNCVNLSLLTTIRKSGSHED